MRGGRVSRYWTGISVRGIALAWMMKEKRQPCRADLRTSFWQIEYLRRAERIYRKINTDWWVPGRHLYHHYIKYDGNSL
jgi:hypothetical protein